MLHSNEGNKNPQIFKKRDMCCHGNRVVHLHKECDVSDDLFIYAGLSSIVRLIVCVFLFCTPAGRNSDSMKVPT